MDDRARVIAALRGVYGSAAPVRVADPETVPVCPAVVVPPAECVPLVTVGSGALLYGVTQALRIAGRSFAQLKSLAAQAEAAMAALGYRLSAIRFEDGPPRAVRLAFRAAFDTEGNVYHWEENG